MEEVAAEAELGEVGGTMVTEAGGGEQKRGYYLAALEIHNYIF